LTGKIEKWQHQQPKVVTASVSLGNFDTGGEGGIPSHCHFGFPSFAVVCNVTYAQAAEMI
jgi:hypothetical protein